MVPWTRGVEGADLPPEYVDRTPIPGGPTVEPPEGSIVEEVADKSRYLQEIGENFELKNVADWDSPNITIHQIARDLGGTINYVAWSTFSEPSREFANGSYILSSAAYNATPVLGEYNEVLEPQGWVFSYGEPTGIDPPTGPSREELAYEGAHTALVYVPGTGQAAVEQPGVSQPASPGKTVQVNLTGSHADITEALKNAGMTQDTPAYLELVHSDGYAVLPTAGRTTTYVKDLFFSADGRLSDETFNKTNIFGYEPPETPAPSPFAVASAMYPVGQMSQMTANGEVLPDLFVFNDGKSLQLYSQPRALGMEPEQVGVVTGGSLQEVGDVVAGILNGAKDKKYSVASASAAIDEIWSIYDKAELAREQERVRVHNSSERQKDRDLELTLQADRKQVAREGYAATLAGTAAQYYQQAWGYMIPEGQQYTRGKQPGGPFAGISEYTGATYDPQPAGRIPIDFQQVYSEAQQAAFSNVENGEE